MATKRGPCTRCEGVIRRFVDWAYELLEENTRLKKIIKILSEEDREVSNEKNL
jgi:hypothetical protein